MVAEPRTEQASLRIPETASTLPLPPGWTEIEDAAAPMVRGPEGDVEMGFVTVPGEASARDMAVAAWRRLALPRELEVLQEQDVPTADGWDRARQIVYRVRDRDEDIALALLRILGDRAYATLLVASKAGLDRRMAQVLQLIQGWRPDGLRAEDLSGRMPRAWGERESEALNTFVHRGMDALGIPGVAVAVVQDGRIVECRGFGRCGVDAPVPVTGDTPFMIGSSTKALTTLMMARLIGTGRFAWSTPVVELMPEFAFADLDMTRRMQMRHTVSASTGMPRSDMELAFQADGNDPERCLARMQRMRPTTGFGETFQYSNQLVALGGFAAARAAAPGCRLADAYRRVMQEQVFGPLGMSRTSLRDPGADRALPHALDLEGMVRPLDLRIESFAATVAPAGAAWSTARDLARYLQMELAGGRDPAGGEYIDRDLLRQRYEPQIRIGRESSYGLGLILAKASGLEEIGHGGNTFGFSATLWFLPEQQIGLVVLTNLAVTNDFLAAVGQKIRELLFGAEEKSDELISIAARTRETAAAQVGRRIGADGPAQAWIAELAGTWVCDELGRAEIRRDGDGHRMQFAAWSSALGVETSDDGRRQLALISPPWSGKLLFRVEDGGGTLVHAGSGQQQYAFRRQSV